MDEARSGWGRFGWRPALQVPALLLACLSVAGAVHADEVGHRCVAGCDDASTTDASPSTASPEPSAPPPSPMHQQMMQQLNGAAFDLGYSIGQSLFSSSAAPEYAQASALNDQAVAAGQRGDWHRAESLTRQALQLLPADTVLQANFRMVRSQALNSDAVAATNRGDWAAAGPLLQQATALSPENQTLRENLRLVQQHLADQEAQAAARRREEMAQHLSGQLKLAGSTSAAPADNPLGLKLGGAAAPAAALPVAVANADNPLGLKLGKHKPAPKDWARDDTMRDSVADKGPAVEHASESPRELQCTNTIPDVDQLLPQYPVDDYYHVVYRNHSGRPVTVHVCINHNSPLTTSPYIIPDGETGELLLTLPVNACVATLDPDPCKL